MSDKIKAALVFVVLLISAVAEPIVNCARPEFFNQPRLNFDESQAYSQNFRLDPVGCSCRRANLVTIDSSEENSFIHSLWQSMREPADDRQHVRIGYTEEGSEGRWRWISGSTSSYTEWDSGQPGNYGSGQDCAVMRKSSNDAGIWDDLNCGYDEAFICEY